MSSTSTSSLQLHHIAPPPPHSHLIAPRLNRPRASSSSLLAHSAHGSAQVSSATSTIMVFFMSSANVGQFVVFGMLDLEYALFYGTVGVLGAIVGTKGAKSLIERTGRASFLMFFLAAILFGSGLLMAYVGIPQVLKSGLTGFRPICGRAGAAAREGDR